MISAAKQTSNSKVLSQMVNRLSKRQGRTVRCGASTSDRKGMVVRLRRGSILDFCVFSKGEVEREGPSAPLLADENLILRLCFSDRKLRNITNFILETLAEEGLELCGGDSSEKTKT